MTAITLDWIAAAVIAAVGVAFAWSLIDGRRGL